MELDAAQLPVAVRQRLVGLAGGGQLVGDAIVRAERKAQQGQQGGDGKGDPYTARGKDQ